MELSPGVLVDTGRQSIGTHDAISDSSAFDTRFTKDLLPQALKVEELGLVRDGL
jgi:hypothetical protein